MNEMEELNGAVWRGYGAGPGGGLARGNDGGGAIVLDPGLRLALGHVAPLGPVLGLTREQLVQGL